MRALKPVDSYDPPRNATRPSKLLVWAIAAIGLALAANADSYPERPIKIIVPTNAGGEVDTLVRIFQRAFQENDLLPVKTVVVNMPGAGGTLGTRKIKDSRADGYTIGVWTPGIVTSKAMGIAKYDHSAFEIIGRTGYSDLGFGVNSDSKFNSIQELIELSKANPKSLQVATNIGLPVHLIPLMFAESAGTDFKFIQIGGGSKRLSSILGGHTDMAMFSLLAFIQYKDAGIKPLVVLSEQRTSLFPDVPTAKEIGVDLVMQDTRIWLAPKGTPRERIELIATALRTAMELPEVKKEFKTLGIHTTFGDAAELQPFLDNMLRRVTPLVAKARGR
ncbi:MAG: tripartite tricarboxylate transporter substrate binding protein [Opitutaceae bacterium]|nr:tripartite tricarboxylate transporter substrate binding protein [Opitutaceae bacterium]